MIIRKGATINDNGEVSTKRLSISFPYAVSDSSLGRAFRTTDLKGRTIRSSTMASFPFESLEFVSMYDCSITLNQKRW